MRILIENPSSAGSSLTQNTIDTLKTVFLFCEKKPNTYFNLQSVIVGAGLKWKNARTIFPLMRYLCFVSYETYTGLNTNSFFTERGRVFMHIVLLEENGECTPEIKKELQGTRYALIRAGLNSLLLDKSCNYEWIIRKTLEYLLLYSKIDKKEFAYLVYAEKNGISIGSEEFSEIVYNYRKRLLHLDVSVEIRNDQDKKTATKKVDDRYLTAFGYVTNILIQAGLAEKGDGYCLFYGPAHDDVDEILKGAYDEQSR